MKYPKAKAVENLGVSYVRRVVSACGSIFRRIPEEDIGIDGHIEFVHSEQATGQIVAVQIKSGASYVSEDRKIFRLHASAKHFEYWASLRFPVAGIVYDPSQDWAVWCDITQHLRAHPSIVERGPYTISIPRENVFCKESFESFVHHFLQYATILDYAEIVERMLSDEPRVQYRGLLEVLSTPSIRNRRQTCLALSTLVTTRDKWVRANACDALSRYLPHPEVGFFPPEHVRSYVTKLIRTFNMQHIRLMLEVIDENGLERGGVGESIAEIIRAIPNNTAKLARLAEDNKSNYEIRFFAILLMGYLWLKNALPFLRRLDAKLRNPDLLEVVKWSIQVLES